MRRVMVFKGFLKKTGRKESGMILPLALILLVAATLIVMPGLGFMSSLLTINSNAQQDVLAYYAADAGISAVNWYWNETPASISISYLPAINNPINGMTVTVAAAVTHGPNQTYDNYTITSSATDSRGKTRAKINALIQVATGGNAIFTQAAASLNGDITMSGGAHIISDSTTNFGNIYSNRNITLSPSAIVGGTSCPAKGVASAHGTVTGNGVNGACAGSVVTGVPTENYTIDTQIQAFIQQATNQGTHYASNPVPGYGTFTFPGPAYISGNLDIGGSVTCHLRGTVYCTGNLHIGNSAVVDGAYTIVSAGTVTIDGAANAGLTAGNIPFIICLSTATWGVNVSGSGQTAAVIYAPNTGAYLYGSGLVYGAVIAKTIKMEGSATIKYMSGILLGLETQIPGASPIGGTLLLMGYNYQ